MEYFTCPSADTGDVILDGNNQGPNKDGTSQLLTKQTNEGRHSIALNCINGKKYQAKIVDIRATDPIAPLQVPFP